MMVRIVGCMKFQHTKVRQFIQIRQAIKKPYLPLYHKTHTHTHTHTHKLVFTFHRLAIKVTYVLLCSRLRYHGEAPAAGYKGYIRHNDVHKVRNFSMSRSYFGFLDSKNEASTVFPNVGKYLSIYTM